MIDTRDFRKYAHEFADWMADYYAQVEQYPVKSLVQPREIFDRIPSSPPVNSEPMDTIFRDFREIIMPGITHWQSPNYLAYFTANSSYPSILAEMLTATLGAQCMIWDTSPAAAELEEKMMIWLKHLLGLPEMMEGVIQDTGSTATLVALLTAREKMTGYSSKTGGLAAHPGLRVYASPEVHSSIDKAVRIAGLGQDNLVRIAVDKSLAMKPEALREAIQKDLAIGLKPLCVVAALGTTGTLAIDPLEPIAEICREYGIWLHVDAAFAGTALVLPEYRGMIKGIEHVDSFFFNPHKWMFTNFDCSAYFVRDKEALISTFEILPEYLKTKTRGQVNDYRDWGIQLGRRFRALKLWFMLRDYGVNGIREKVSYHIRLAGGLAEKIRQSKHFVLHEPQNLALVCFRYKPEGVDQTDQLNEFNLKLLQSVNATGKTFLTHTKVNGLVTLRIVTGQTNIREENVEQAWKLLNDLAPAVNN
jgi:aromatic-L-amino-acid decarboxylase